MPTFPTNSLKINGRPIGPGQAALLVAEIGGNHGGDAELASHMVEAAARAGAGAVKFQAYRTHNFLSRLSPYYDELAAEELPFADLASLVKLAHTNGLAAGLTIFDEQGLRLAAECGADFIKISSGDLTNYPLLEKAVTAEQPVFISTGAADEEEVNAALKICAPARDRLVIMQCTSLYPAPPETANLAVMASWLNNGLAAGYSDHVSGLTVAWAALSLGAMVLEKHFTTDQTLPGGDNAISALPEDFTKLRAWPAEKHNAIKSAAPRPVWWGRAEKRPHPLELPMRPVIRRAVVAAEHLSAGQVLTKADLALRRPPAGGEFLGPKDYEKLPGRTLKRDLPAGTPLTWPDLA